jgi:hypothetical protein
MVDAIRSITGFSWSPCCLLMIIANRWFSYPLIIGSRSKRTLLSLVSFRVIMGAGYLFFSSAVPCLSIGTGLMILLRSVPRERLLGTGLAILLIVRSVPRELVIGRGLVIMFLMWSVTRELVIGKGLVILVSVSRELTIGMGFPCSVPSELMIVRALVITFFVLRTVMVISFPPRAVHWELLIKKKLVFSIFLSLVPNGLLVEIAPSVLMCGIALVALPSGPLGTILSFLITTLTGYDDRTTFTLPSGSITIHLWLYYFLTIGLLGTILSSLITSVLGCDDRTTFTLPGSITIYLRLYSFLTILVAACF